MELEHAPVVLLSHRLKEVTSRLFQQEEYRWLSAVLFCSHDVFNLFSLGATRWADGIEVVHNPRVTVPLPRGAFQFGTEYWTTGGELESQSWVKEHQTETPQTLVML